jgi:hypothetical protein
VPDNPQLVDIGDGHVTISGRRSGNALMAATHSRTATAVLWLTALIVGTTALLSPAGEFTEPAKSAGRRHAVEAAAWV